MPTKAEFPSTPASLRPSPPSPPGLARREVATGATVRAAVTRGKRPWRRYFPWLLGAILLAGLVFALAPKPVPVETAMVSEGSLSVSVLEEGKTRIRHRFTISPPVAGFVQRVPLRAGDRIVAGETVLLELQAEPASLLNPRSQSEAEARVNAAAAAVHQRESDLERVRAQNELAARELRRAEPLRKSGAISTKEWDATEMESSMRGRELRSAEFALQVATFELKQAEAALLQARGESPAAGEPLQVLAPVNGFILNVFEESARVVPAGTAIMEVGDPADLEAEIELLSTDAAQVAVGASAAIERWGGPQPLRGTVSLVEPAAFTKISALGVEEQRVKVRVQFEEAVPAALTLGDRYRVEARIVTWQSERVCRVPTGALFRRGGDWMCFLLQRGHAALRKVEIAHNNGVLAEVGSGLAVGETVLVHPPDVVVEGSRVVAR